MKYILLLFIFFTGTLQAQDLLQLNDYGIDASIDTKGMELYSSDTTLKSNDARHVVALEFDGFKKINILCLKPGKKAAAALTEMEASAKQKKLKIALKERNAIIVEQKGTYKLFYACVVKGQQYFIQSGLCSTLEKAQALLDMVKTMQ